MAEQKSKVPASDKGEEDIEGGDDEGRPPPKTKEPTEKEEEQANDGEDGDEDAGEGDDDDIPVRRSSSFNMQQVIARKNRKIAKMQEEKDQGKKPAQDADDEEDDADDIDRKIERAVEKRIGPLQQHVLSRADEEELQSLYAEDPDAKEYDKRIRKYMESEHYRNVPPSVIYHHLAFGGAKAQGAKKKDVADREAAQTRGIGHSRRPKPSPAGGIPDVSDMSEEEFETLSTDVKRGKFIS